MDKLTLEQLKQMNKNRMWAVKQLTDNVLDLYIYGAVEGDGYDWQTGEKIKSETSQEYFRDILAANPNVKEINLYVNSQGGSVFEAMGIRSQLKRHPAKVTAYVDGWAASAASYIITAADEVKMYKSSMQMLHNIWVFAAGNAAELRELADELDKLMEGNRQAYLEKAAGKITEEQLIDLMSKDTWLNAEDCMAMGLCDEILEAEAPVDTSAPEEAEKLRPEQHTPKNLIDTTQEKPPDCNTPKEEAKQADSEDQAPKGAIFMRAFKAALERN